MPNLKSIFAFGSLGLSIYLLTSHRYLSGDIERLFNVQIKSYIFYIIAMILMGIYGLYLADKEKNKK